MLNLSIINLVSCSVILVNNLTKLNIDSCAVVGRLLDLRCSVVRGFCRRDS